MKAALVVALALLAAPPPEAPLPAVRDGDLVFHTSKSRQSQLVALATGSRWTHMGIVVVQDGEPWVLEAVQPVKLTKLSAWISRGDAGRVVVKRLAKADEVLTAGAVAKMRELGKAWLGKDYDLRFQWSDESLYCSELVFKLYEQGAGVEIGRKQKAGEMRLADPKVQKELKRRFPRESFSADEIVVTPQSMFEDPALVTVYER